ncbi:MAG: peptidylprolyl isomerase [Clostridia bacterium]|nr:peptidylprolyl isomerase [Clostridia bacterium]
MARSSYSSDLLEEGYNSAGSQFYICLKDAPSLNGLYAAFGKVISGMDTVDKISEVELGVNKNEKTGEETPTTKPANDVVIKSIRVETNGVNYGIPKVHDAFDYSAWYMKKYYGI